MTFYWDFFVFFFAVLLLNVVSWRVKKNTSSCLCCALSGFTWPQTVQRAFMVKFLPPQGQIQPIHAFSALSSATQDVSPKRARKWTKMPYDRFDGSLQNYSECHPSSWSSTHIPLSPVLINGTRALASHHTVSKSDMPHALIDRLIFIQYKITMQR